MVIAIFTSNILVSACSCVETLVAIAYGANDHKLCRMYLNRQFFINTVAFAILCIPSFFSTAFFENVLSQSAEVSLLATQAYQIMMVGIYFHLQAYTICMFAIAMNEPTITTIAFGVAIAIFVPLVLTSFFVFEQGFIGVCVCTAMHNIIQFVVSYSCVCFKATFREANESTRVISMDSVSNLGYQLKLNVASLFFYLPKWQVHEILYFCAITISVDA